MSKIILASKSPRRMQLLQMLGLDVTQAVSDFDESTVSSSDPCLLVETLAVKKATAVAEKFSPSDYIIAADTVVDLDGQVIGKPHDKEDAVKMLSSLSGRTHSVHTGIAIFHGGKTASAVETANVTFRSLSQNEISAYVESGDPMDKAGAYGIQGFAGCFVSRIEGDYYTIVGLPICKIAIMLQKIFGTDITKLSQNSDN